MDVSTIADEQLTDHDIINKVLNGQKEYYALIVRRYNQLLYRIASTILNDNIHTEDVMQVAYIKAYQNLSQFSSKSSFATWLTKILINEALHTLKNRKRIRLLPSDHALLSIHTKTDNRNPLKKIVNTELRNQLEEAIKKLPPIYRQVFIMREIEQMSVSETKECLNISENNIKVRLTRARQLLKKSLSANSTNDIYHFHLDRCDRIAIGVMNTISSPN
jgi:RNA polymerase sigma-70 factor (ECF subfamily)